MSIFNSFVCLWRSWGTFLRAGTLESSFMMVPLCSSPLAANHNQSIDYRRLPPSTTCGRQINLLVAVKEVRSGSVMRLWGCCHRPRFKILFYLLLIFPRLYLFFFSPFIFLSFGVRENLQNWKEFLIIGTYQRHWMKLI